MPVEAGAAGAQFAPDRHLGQVLHPQRRVATGGDDDLADLGDILDAAGGSHDIILAVALDIVRAAAGIVGLHRLDDVGERDAIGDRLGRIRRDLILLDVTADGVGAGDTCYHPHLRADDPVLDRAQVDRAFEIVVQIPTFGREIAAVALPARLAIGNRRVFSRLLVLDRPPIDFTQPRRDRTEPDLGFRRKRLPDLLQALVHLLTREVDVGLVAEDRRHLGKAVTGERARVFEGRRARQRIFDLERDLLLHLDRRQRRCDGIDLHLVVGDVRHGIDWQLIERPDAKSAGDGGQQHDEPAVTDRKVEDFLDHHSSAFAFPRSDFRTNVLRTATMSPGLRPPVTSTASSVMAPACTARASNPSGTCTNAVSFPSIV